MTEIHPIHLSKHRDVIRKMSDEENHLKFYNEMQAMDVRLTPAQMLIDKAENEGARNIYLKAGRKFGKTKLMEWRMIKHSRSIAVEPDQVNPYIAPSYRQAKNILWRRLKLSMPRALVEKKFRESDLVIDMKSGVRNQLFGSENEDSIRGLTFGPGTLDEADFMRPGFYEEVYEPNFAKTQAGSLVSSTPKNGWFTKRWKMAKDGRLGRDSVAFHFTIYDNPHLSKEFIEKLKASVSADIWQQEYMANEASCSGLQYSEFDDRHVVAHREPKKDGIFGRSLDWGWQHPSHVLWGEMYLNPNTGRWNLYVYREFSIRGVNVAALCAPILTVDLDKYFLFTVIDAAASRTEMSTGQTILHEFHQQGLHCRKSTGTNDYKLNALKIMLRQGDIQISENCPILIRQLRSVEWGAKKNDDAADSLKYFAAEVYKKDFNNYMDSIQNGKGEGEIIDPNGLLGDNNSMHWEVAI